MCISLIGRLCLAVAAGRKFKFRGSRAFQFGKFCRTHELQSQRRSRTSASFDLSVEEGIWECGAHAESHKMQELLGSAESSSKDAYLFVCEYL